MPPFPAVIPQVATPPRVARRHPFLVLLGERIREERARKGMSRKALALDADISERHLANLERGVGNASVLVLLGVAGALRCQITDLLVGAPSG
ncbi:helix-turn-helix domain-containing protein [Piscinibacter sakaiensis]|uniref:Regulatory protein of benzoate catabolism n=1 Tax=Piscinibacter sakaiensis TaxID=1547922 RepID=A0A0K8P3E1_PISS1|nr:regulatory protein of benzoate catabolism [Piscinibacter sakaiensis]